MTVEKSKFREAEPLAHNCMAFEEKSGHLTPQQPEYGSLVLVPRYPSSQMVTRTGLPKDLEPTTYPVSPCYTDYRGCTRAIPAPQGKLLSRIQVAVLRTA